MSDCIFCKIIAGDIPVAKVYEDDTFFVFLDAFPASKGHTLVIPKKHCDDLLDLSQSDSVAFMPVLQKIAQAVFIGTSAQGFITTNANKKYAGQSVFHLHYHIIPRYETDGIKFQAKADWWIPQKDLYSKGEKEIILAKIREALK